MVGFHSSAPCPYRLEFRSNLNSEKPGTGRVWTHHGTNEQLAEMGTTNDRTERERERERERESERGRERERESEGGREGGKM